MGHHVAYFSYSIILYRIASEETVNRVRVVTSHSSYHSPQPQKFGTTGGVIRATLSYHSLMKTMSRVLG